MHIMARFLWLLLGANLTCWVYASPQVDYLNRFQNYLAWSQNLPNMPDSSFLAFIESDKPLSNRLREKWLYHLAQNKDWVAYQHYYQSSKDMSLQCYYQIALFNLAQVSTAVAAAKTLWLTGESRPPACDLLFSIMLKQNKFDQALIKQRFDLALAANNIPLASYLLEQYIPPQRSVLKSLIVLQKYPIYIAKLAPSPFYQTLYLYGLKKLIAVDMDKAEHYWQEALIHNKLTFEQQQSFLLQLAIFKAIRNLPDAEAWFNKINPHFYTEALLAAEVHYALKFKQWRRVQQLIQQLPDSDLPCWQYWLARALEAQGQHEQSLVIYEKLAKARHYYGFLASLQLKKAPHFANEPVVLNQDLLKTYAPFLALIKNLYLSKQNVQASRLLNDFVSELPKNEQSAIVYWLAHEVQWHGKSVSLSNQEKLSNQLFLRFPLAYRQTVATYAKNYQLPAELIYAIIRQESEFREDAVSSAGAHGLMQLMPLTAKIVSKIEKIPYHDKNQLFTSQKNINIGTAYLKQLAKRFKNHPTLMIAAYNAGPKQVVYWLKNHPINELDIWIETLPWVETRNYLKNVIAFYTVYQYRMNTKPDLTPFMKQF